MATFLKLNFALSICMSISISRPSGSIVKFSFCLMRRKKSISRAQGDAYNVITFIIRKIIFGLGKLI